MCSLKLIFEAFLFKYILPYKVFISSIGTKCGGPSIIFNIKIIIYLKNDFLSKNNHPYLDIHQDCTNRQLINSENSAAIVGEYVGRTCAQIISKVIFKCIKKMFYYLIPDIFLYPQVFLSNKCMIRNKIMFY